MARVNALRWLWLSAVMLLIDQISKHIVASSMALFQSETVTSFFNLVYVHNYGAAFSFLDSQGGMQRWFFSALAVVVCLVLVWCLKRMREPQPLSAAGYALVISGALGNVIDRLLYGYVIDFLDFHYGSYHWPAFNVADSCICIGAVLLILDSFIHPSKRPSKESS
ncbi:signal peptidase II [Celerinatantimonas diazotrophica]|uniref:Lipoprotein signal peptidase n=1 Tax=Celerinatantimonas diazotrophica TaxID=412034 RepID=A0A4V2PNH5_9GAMM|nr:signal peptidase II [Celerinatantimonas diazotrophica]TCK47041.1 signal peptidase II [Celerinatantimonas diazotrophica]CAG9295809.1 Lipoprotein signal peptidase [Celerinatantimonas diazotrophica]